MAVNGYWLNLPRLGVLATKQQFRNNALTKVENFHQLPANQQMMRNISQQPQGKAIEDFIENDGALIFRPEAVGMHPFHIG